MPAPKGPCSASSRPMSIRDLARKLAREEQFFRGNDTADSDDDFNDEVYVPPRPPSPRSGFGAAGRSASLREGAARMMASDLGVDPDLAAQAGPAASKVLGALSDANGAEDRAEKTRCIDRAQKHLRTIDPSRHGELVQQLQARLLAAQGRGGDTEVAHVTPGELVVPPHLQTPELMARLRDAAEAQGIDAARLFVGSARNSVNPRTGTREFWTNGMYDSNIETFTVTAPGPSSFGFNNFFSDPWSGFVGSDSGSGPGNGFGWGAHDPTSPAPTSTPEPNPRIEEIIVHGQRLPRNNPGLPDFHGTGTPPPSQGPDPSIEEIIVTAPRITPGSEGRWDRLNAILHDFPSATDDDLVWARQMGWVIAAEGAFLGATSLGGTAAIPRMYRHIPHPPKGRGYGIIGLGTAIGGAARWLTSGAPQIEAEIQRRENNGTWNPTKK